MMENIDSRVDEIKKSIESMLYKYQDMFEMGNIQNETVYALHMIIEEKKMQAFENGYIDGFLDGRQ